MKTLNFKNMVPIAVIALGISGAFVTTSMQSASKSAFNPKIGYLANSQGKCINTPVNCDDTPSAFLCRIGGTSGAVAYDKDVATNNCVQPLYRP
ncbi:hypothetical protein [Flavobacterium sp. DG2-3]|uniref:hypothetical protein n=1 Tax=Flavobacterium sp. DG2-3 TaxID=3068317 RepID=UPI00273CFD42|nr:hypothetical protein [Flavobacterium sp. DG2-3]MDP5198995.1 hypothetical protein [Flavobacterium sp. DG2-3]